MNAAMRDHWDRKFRKMVEIKSAVEAALNIYTWVLDEWSLGRRILSVDTEGFISSEYKMQDGPWMHAGPNVNLEELDRG